MEIGEAFGEEQIYPDTLQYAPMPPDPIDTLSDMDLLIYSSLTNNSKVYALPRTLSGNDLSTSIWDNIIVRVNNRYFQDMPYDAAGAAYNVVQVRYNDDGTIDVYLILTYRRYTLLNDELSVDGELNCAVIWQYKENENGEIEFSNMYWPIKDSKGRVSYGNREWPEDLQKYTDFSPDSIGRAERLKAIDEQIAISMDNNEKVDALLSTIVSSPKGSSARIDYIHEHVGEYGQLCAMGRRAVSRFMSRFEKGYETGLEGQIMAAVLNALTGVDSLGNYKNGQEWYDASRNGILAYMRAADEKATLQTAAEAFLTMYFDKMCDRDSGLDYARDKYAAQNGQLLLADDNYNDMMLLRQWIDHKDMLADFGYDIQGDCGRFVSLDVHSIQPVQNGELLQNGDYVLRGYFKTTAFGTLVELGMMDTGGIFAITSVSFPDWKEYNNFCNDFIAFMKDKGYTDYGKSSYIDAKRKEREAFEAALQPTPAPAPTPAPTASASSGSYEPPIAGRTAQATTDVNIRSGPGTHYDKLGQLKKGEIVPQTGTVNEWIKIHWNGQTAYVHEDYCILNAQAQERVSSLANTLDQSGYFKKNADIYLGMFGDPLSDVFYIRVSGGTNVDRITGDLSALLADESGTFKVMASSLPSYVNEAYIKELMNSISQRVDSLSPADKALFGFNAMYYDPEEDKFIVELLDMDDTKIANFRQLVSNWEHITFVSGSAIAVPMT